MPENRTAKVWTKPQVAQLGQLVDVKGPGGTLAQAQSAGAPS